MAQHGWLIDLDRCIGCHSCTVACKSEQNTAPTKISPVFKEGNIQTPAHVSYRWVVVQEGGTYPQVLATLHHLIVQSLSGSGLHKVVPGQGNHKACL